MLPEIESNNFKQALQKVGDLNDSTGKYELRKQYFKELDVWSYNFPSSEDRQRAIDNAVKQYDKMRLGVSEPEWDRLLPKAERGTGKSLSKLQAQIARGDLQQRPPPKIKVQKEEDSSRDTSGPEDDGLPEEKVEKKEKKAPKVKAESTNRSVSQPPAPKAKKVEKETQPKKWMSKTKPTSKPTSAPAKKQTPAKTGGKVLSSEYVEDSDEEDDYAEQPPKPAPKSITITKRSREEEADSSDSSIPLSKKVKKDAPATTAPHRVSDASQSSRTTNTSTHSSSSTKTKDTSPQKSSPLASSPPTNASDVDNSSGDRTSSSSSASPANHLGSKNSRSPIHKRHHKSSSVASSVSSTSSTRYLKPEVMDLARKYRSYYPKYEALHKELAGLKARNYDKEAKLMDMHERLAQMKRDINAGIVEVS
jgi:RNA polymerase II elongation factor ELL